MLTAHSSLSSNHFLPNDWARELRKAKSFLSPARKGPRTYDICDGGVFGFQVLPESISQISKVLDTEEQVKNEEGGIEPVQTVEEKAEPGKNEEEGTEPAKTEEEGKEERRPSFTSSVTVNVRRLFFISVYAILNHQRNVDTPPPPPNFFNVRIQSLTNFN